LKELTQRLTAEFGIRPFLDRLPDPTLAILSQWVKDPSEHVRRLVSEGTRPRLPWGMQLKGFISNPAATLHLLEALKDDPSEYVRRSVANHLNDMAKDHPDFVCEVARRWWKDAGMERRKTIRHALRTLVKQGHKEALAILGYETVKVRVTGMRLEPAFVAIGGKLSMEVELVLSEGQASQVVLDYAIHYHKANGTQRPKVFKWTTQTLKPGETCLLRKQHAFVVVTTRTLYPGPHAVEIFVNGESLAKAGFLLVAAR
jgi:3-methyladenine DNA glycosylase AlkC